MGQHQDEIDGRAGRRLRILTVGQQEQRLPEQSQQQDFFDPLRGPPKSCHGNLARNSKYLMSCNMSPANTNFTSLGGLDAILRLYNVAADPGEKGSRLRQFKGYFTGFWTNNATKSEHRSRPAQLLAQTHFGEPGKKYAKNEVLRLPDKKHIKVSIDWAIGDDSITLPN